MSVYIRGQEFNDEYLEEQDQYLEEFVVLDMLKSFITTKLPSDISYFDTVKLDAMFKEIEMNNGKSEDYAYAISSIVVNIGNAVRQPHSLDKMYKAHIRYKGQVLTYYNKYKDKLSITGIKKIRHSVEGQFKHSEINLAKAIFNGIKIKNIPLSRIPLAALKMDPKSIGGITAASIIDTYLSFMAVKYYDMLEAVRVYKRAVYSDWDIEDFQTRNLKKIAKEESMYFYETTCKVLDDMLKLYEQL